MKSTLMNKALGLLALGLITTGAQANWTHRSPGHAQAHQQTQVYSQQINARQERQMDRVRAGLHNGSLTRYEFRGLMHEQRRIRAMEHHFRADGVIDGWEFRQLDRALDEAGRDIRAEKHDRQARGAYRYGGYGSRFN